jgi:hypothetical protein
MKFLVVMSVEQLSRWVVRAHESMNCILYLYESYRWWKLLQMKRGSHHTKCWFYENKHPMIWQFSSMSTVPLHYSHSIREANNSFYSTNLNGLLRSCPCFEVQLWFYPCFCHHCDFTPSFWKRSLCLLLLREQQVMVSNGLNKDKLAHVNTLRFYPVLKKSWQHHCTTCYI